MVTLWHVLPPLAIQRPGRLWYEYVLVEEMLFYYLDRPTLPQFASRLHAGQTNHMRDDFGITLRSWI